MAEEKEMVELEKFRVSEEQLAKDAFDFVKSEWDKLKSAVSGAELTASTIKVAIGKRLLHDFFNDDWRLLYIEGDKKGRKFIPVKKKAWKAVLTQKGFPIKSKTGQLNILRCGGQAKWAEEEKISLENISFTSQVHLIKLENGEQKKGVIELINNNRHEDPKKTEAKKWSSRDVDNYVRKLKAVPPKVTEDFDKEVFKGAEFTAALTDDLMEALKRYQQYNPEMPDRANYVISKDRIEIKKAIDVTINEFQAAIERLRKAKETLKEKDKGRKKDKIVDEDDEEEEAATA